MIKLPALVADINIQSLPAEPELILDNLAITTLVENLIILLLVATLVALVARWLKIPYVVGLVLAGLAIPRHLSIGLNPELILNLFLPILIFEAAINTDISRLRSTIKPIAVLAGPGVVISAAITAVLLKMGLGLAWITAAGVSVILTITDTVSVIAAFRTVPVPRRLATIVEGESLLNDGVAMVLLSVITTIHIQGGFSAGEGIKQIFVAFVGGGLVGLGLGYLCVGLFRQLNDDLSDILLTVSVSLGTFQIGQMLGVSSAIAVVVAGLVIGNLAFKQTSASIKVTLLSFWQYAGFGVNTLIFLLVGIEVYPRILLTTIPAALIAIVAYQIGRIFSIYPLLYLLRFFDRPLPLRWQHVLIAGNVKGSLSMALALALPLTLPGRDQVVTLVFSTVMVSLIGQGLSLPWVVKKLQLTKPSPLAQKIAVLQLNLVTAKAAQGELKYLLETGSLPKFLYEELFADYQARIANSEQELREFYNQRDLIFSKGEVEKEYIDGLYRRLYIAEKSAINDALAKGILADDISDEYLQVLNEKLLALQDD
jgi:CPA1 family monovalent cation:H+ antiporter